MKSRFLISVLGLAAGASAHLVAGSLRPQGGESFSRGSVLAIHWVIEQEHSGNYQISYSPSPGVWVVLLSGLRNNGARFNQAMDTSWRIPDTLAPSSTARIRVWQSSPEPGNTNASDSTNFYTLVSRNFSITTGGAPVIASRVDGTPTWNRMGRVLSIRGPAASGPGNLFLYRGNGRLSARLTASASQGEWRFDLPGHADGNILRFQKPDGPPMTLSLP